MMAHPSRIVERQADLLALGVLVAALSVCALSAHLVWNIGWLPGICLIAGMTLVWVGACVFRDRLIRPLRTMVQQVQQMRQTKQWEKLKVAGDGELKAVALGFNELVEHVLAQQRCLGDQINELQRVNTELDNLATVKDDFLQTINHQLRTPMTAIIEGVELLQDKGLGPLNKEQQSYADIVQNNAERLKSLLEDMLDLSMLKSGRRPLQRRVEELTGCLHAVCNEWQSQSPAVSVTLKTGLLPAVYMDSRAITDVLNHLLRNATRYAPEKSEVGIETFATDSLVKICVRNQGQPLSTEQVKRLFEPFVHLHTPESPGSQGSGLGLAYCRHVIERHGGSIQVESEKGLGTAVTVSLPIASPQFMLVDACRMAQEESEADGSTFGICLARSASRDVEDLLRKNTHRGDRFVRLGAGELAIVAVTDDTGLALMIRRLRSVLEERHFAAALAGAMYPLDGDQPERLLLVARQRLASPVGV